MSKSENVPLQIPQTLLKKTVLRNADIIGNKCKGKLILDSYEKTGGN
jgi:hypothetical protein